MIFAGKPRSGPFAAVLGITLLPLSAFAQGNGSRCSVPRFTGAGSAAGAVASMHVVNDGRPCGFHMLSGGNNVESITITEPPAHGKVDVKDASVRYTPNPGYVGEDQFRAVSSASHKVLMRVDVAAPSK